MMFAAVTVSDFAGPGTQMISIDEVIVGVMVDAIAAAGRRFAAAIVALRNRGESEYVAVAARSKPIGSPSILRLCQSCPLP